MTRDDPGAANRMLSPAVEELVIDTRTGRSGTAEAWVAVFADVWRTPKDRLEDLLALLSPDVALEAPTRPPRSVGRDAARKAFQRAFRAMPDLRGEVKAWAMSPGGLFIAMEFVATIGGVEVRWPNVDWFTFNRGVAVRRRAHFDPTLVRRAMTRSPGALLKLLRMRFGR